MCTCIYICFVIFVFLCKLHGSLYIKRVDLKKLKKNKSNAQKKKNMEREYNRYLINSSRAHIYVFVKGPFVLNKNNKHKSILFIQAYKPFSNMLHIYEYIQNIFIYNSLFLCACLLACLTAWLPDCMDFFLQVWLKQSLMFKEKKAKKDALWSSYSYHNSIWEFCFFFQFYLIRCNRHIDIYI